MMNRILITGAQGFVGRYLIAHWLKSDSQAEIFGIGRSPFLADVFTHTVHCGNKELPAPLPEELRIANTTRYAYASVDIRRRTELLQAIQEFRPDVIVHLASFLRGHDTNCYFDTNIEGTRNLLEAVAEIRPTAKLLFGSSGAVYGAAPLPDLPLKETAGCAPLEEYGVSKLTSEYISRVVASSHNISIVWVRLFNLVGPGQQEIHVCGRLASQVASIMLGMSPPVIRTKALHTARDFIDVRDVATGLEFLGRLGRPGEIYNLASGDETPISTVLENFLNVARLPHVQIERVQEQDTNVVRHFASIERLRALGFAPQFRLKDSLADLLNYYLHDVARYPENAAKTSAAGRQQSAGQRQQAQSDELRPDEGDGEAAARAGRSDR